MGFSVRRDKRNFPLYKGARIKRMSVERGSTVHFHPADSCSDVNRTMVLRRSSLQTNVSSN